MMRRFVLFGLLLAASAAFAQPSADLSAIIRTPPTIDANRGFTWEVDVLNTGPDAAQNVSVTGTTVPTLDTNCFPA